MELNTIAIGARCRKQAEGLLARSQVRKRLVAAVVVGAQHNLGKAGDRAALVDLARLELGNAKVVERLADLLAHLLRAV